MKSVKSVEREERKVAVILAEKDDEVNMAVFKGGGLELTILISTKNLKNGSMTQTDIHT